jgi:hypothetical protein
MGFLEFSKNWAEREHIINHTVLINDGWQGIITPSLGNYLRVLFGSEFFRAKENGSGKKYKVTRSDILSPGRITGKGQVIYDN